MEIQYSNRESYYKKMTERVEEEQRFRDLFGNSELQEAKSKYFAELLRTNETMVMFLRKETLRKLREQDGDIS